MGKAKKKKSKKETKETYVEDVSSPEPLPDEEQSPNKKISPTIERRVQHSEGKVQINVYQVESGRREERNRERLRDERERGHCHDDGYHHSRPRRHGSPDRSPPRYRSSYSINNRNRHLDSYSGRLSRRRR